MKNIYLTLSNELEKDVPLAIATILETKGSTPQVQGASAIISSEGIISGTLGGGILEAEAQNKAIEAINQKSSLVFEADMDAVLSDQESAICGGKAVMLIDASPDEHFEVFREISSSLKNNQAGSLVTHIFKSGEAKVEINRYWISEGNKETNWSDPEILKNIQLIRECLKVNKISFLDNKIIPGNENDTGSAFFIEPVRPLPSLIIAGAGHVGQAVSHISSLLGFDVTVIDDRPEFCNKEKLPDADHLIVDNIAAIMRKIPKTKDAYIVIVTRGHMYDSEVLKQCICSDATYIGMIGSRRKIRLMRQKFIDEGWATPEQFDRVYAPIGLEIGSQTVQEIALSICAQLVQVRSQKTGQEHKPLISAVILAAGESKRMGKPKLLLPYGDKTIIETVIQNAINSEIKNIIVVLGAEKDKIRNQISNYPVIITENPDYLNGMLSSVQCGLRTLPGDTDSVILLLGDQPMISGLVIDQLADTYRHTDKGILIAYHKGKRGHPILFKIKYKKEIEELSVENSLHDFTRKFASDILEVETETPDILRDIDTPEDYNKEIKYRRLS
jgi:xanthine/CO dehydrogenase XdhC/CoxF family maturation factor/CTP:molybdopterin cytidylyltransferase MocA